MSQRLAVVAIAVSTLLFAAALGFRDVVDTWLAHVGAAVVALVLCGVVMRGRLRPLLEIRPLPLASALATGALMVALTHLGFALACELFPGLADVVAGLYRDINRSSLTPIATLPLIAIVATAEELVWRGVALELTRRRLPVVAAAAASIALYTMPHLIAQVWILAAAAVVVGGVFTAQRILYGRLSEPLICHIVWSGSIFAVFQLV